MRRPGCINTAQLCHPSASLKAAPLSPPAVSNISKRLRRYESCLDAGSTFRRYVMTGSDEKALLRSSVACCVRSGSWVSGGRPTVTKEMGPLPPEVILVLDSAIFAEGVDGDS